MNKYAQTNIKWAIINASKHLQAKHCSQQKRKTFLSSRYFKKTFCLARNRMHNAKTTATTTNIIIIINNQIKRNIILNKLSIYTKMKFSSVPLEIQHSN